MKTISTAQLLLSFVMINLAMLLMLVMQGHDSWYIPWVLINALYWVGYRFVKKHRRAFCKQYVLIGMLACALLVLIQMGEYLIMEA